MFSFPDHVVYWKIRDFNGGTGTLSTWLLGSSSPSFIRRYPPMKNGAHKSRSAAICDDGKPFRLHWKCAVYTVESLANMMAASGIRQAAVQLALRPVTARGRSTAMAVFQRFATETDVDVDRGIDEIEDPIALGEALLAMFLNLNLS